MDMDEQLAKIHASSNSNIMFGICAIALFITGILLTFVLRPSNLLWIVLGVIDIILSALGGIFSWRANHYIANR